MHKVMSLQTFLFRSFYNLCELLTVNSRLAANSSLKVNCQLATGSWLTTRFFSFIILSVQIVSCQPSADCQFD